MHALEKILALKAGKKHVETGEIVNCEIDLAGINDLYLQTLRSFYEMGGTRPAKPENCVVFLDHYAPASTILQAENQKKFREFCREHGVRLMDVNQGVCHQVAVDTGLSRPGMLIVITDSHTTIHGALGAFGTGVGATDLAAILISGKLWFKTPEILRIRLEGALRPGVFAKDCILYIIGALGADYGVYKGIEFSGPTLAALPMSERLTLCNMTTEMGAKSAWIEPDAMTRAFLREHGISDTGIVLSDPDFRCREENFRLDDLEPQTAAPHSVDNVSPVSAYEGRPVDPAFLGTCTGGRLEDLTVAAKILRGKKVHPNTRLLVVPASQGVLLAATANGVLQTLIEAGAVFVTPGCAACLGTHEGMLAEGECCITASSRNFPGRMGSNKAEIFVASPASVAAAALTGRITNPAPYLKD